MGTKLFNFYSFHVSKIKFTPELSLKSRGFTIYIFLHALVTLFDLYHVFYI